LRRSSLLRASSIPRISQGWRCAIIADTTGMAGRYGPFAATPPDVPRAVPLIAAAVATAAAVRAARRAAAAEADVAAVSSAGRVGMRELPGSKARVKERGWSVGLVMGRKRSPGDVAPYRAHTDRADAATADPEEEEDEDDDEGEATTHASPIVPLTTASAPAVVKRGEAGRM
jgi:hypothetical protein